MSYVGNFTELMIKALEDTIALFPYIAVSIALAVLAIAAIKLINKLIRWLVKVSNLDEAVKDLFPKGMKISITSFLIVISDIGIISLFLALIIKVLAVAAPEIYEGALLYISKVASVVVMLLVLSVSLDILTRVVELERKTESLFFILLFFFGISMVVDLVGLSPEMKSSLGLGIAIGIGLSLGIFTLWLLFSEHLSRQRTSTS